MCALLNTASIKHGVLYRYNLIMFSDTNELSDGNELHTVMVTEAQLVLHINSLHVLHLFHSDS